MRIVFVLNIVFCSVVCLKTNSKINNDVENVITKVVQKYFAHLQCICVIYEKLDGYLLQDLKLPQYITSFRVVVEDEPANVYSHSSIEPLLETTFEHASVGFVVQLSHPQHFLDAWRVASKGALHRHNPRVLILPTSKNNNISGEMLGAKVTEFIVDITMVDLIVTEGLNQTLQFITTNWGLTKNVLATCEVNQCSDLDENLFPNKLSDLRNKELKVATFTYLPYAIIKPLDGTEVRIAIEYCRRHNCSIRIITDHAQWGQIHENGTGDGILGNVAEERADVGLGALYLWYHEYQFLDYSTPYIRTGVTCLAPKPEPLSALFIFVRPFTLFTWAIVACVLCIAVAALFFIKKLDTFIKRGYKRECTSSEKTFPETTSKTTTQKQDLHHVVRDDSTITIFL